MSKIPTLVVLTILFACQSVGHCQSITPVTGHASLSHVPGFVNRFPAYIDWLNKPWEGDDAPYAALRSQIESAEAKGKLTPLLTSYEREYRQNPKDLQVQFKYFYALWLNRWENDVPFSVKETDDMAKYTYETLELNYPRTYNYTRQTALCLCCWNTAPNLLPYLQRLVRKDPDDLVAKYYLAGMLADTGKIGLQTTAEQLADNLVAQYPSLAVLHVVQGYAYFRVWQTTKDSEAAQKATDSYQAYLRLAPPDGYYRSIIQWCLGKLPKS